MSPWFPLVLHPSPSCWHLGSSQPRATARRYTRRWCWASPRWIEIARLHLLSRLQMSTSSRSRPGAKSRAANRVATSGCCSSTKSRAIANSVIMGKGALAGYGPATTDGQRRCRCQTSRETRGQRETKRGRPDYRGQRDREFDRRRSSLSRLPRSLCCHSSRSRTCDSNRPRRLRVEACCCRSFPAVRTAPTIAKRLPMLRIWLALSMAHGSSIVRHPRACVTCAPFVRGRWRRLHRWQRRWWRR